MKLDGNDSTNAAQRRIVVVGGVAIVPQRFVAPRTQGRGAIVHAISGHQQVEIQHDAMTGIGIQTGHEMGAALHQDRDHADGIENGGETGDLFQDGFVSLPVQGGHAVEITHDVAGYCFVQAIVAGHGQQAGRHQLAARKLHERGPVECIGLGGLPQFGASRVVSSWERQPQRNRNAMARLMLPAALRRRWQRPPAGHSSGHGMERCAPSASGGPLSPL